MCYVEDPRVFLEPKYGQGDGVWGARERVARKEGEQRSGVKSFSTLRASLEFIPRVKGSIKRV